jgi:hypothetical protein
LLPSSGTFGKSCGQRLNYIRKLFCLLHFFAFRVINPYIIGRTSKVSEERYASILRVYATRDTDRGGFICIKRYYF